MAFLLTTWLGLLFLALTTIVFIFAMSSLIEKDTNTTLIFGTFGGMTIAFMISTMIHLYKLDKRIIVKE